MSNQLTRRSFVGLSAAAVGAVALAGCSSNSGTESSSTSTTTGTTTEAEKKTIRLGVTNDGHIYNAIADAQGYLADEGIEVETSIFSTSDDAFQALFSNKIDVISNQGTNLPLTHIAQGQDLTIYAGYMITGCMPIIAPAGTVWNGVEDLVGKTIACSGNEFGVFGPLYDKGYTMADVTTVVLSNHADRVEAVATGKADYAVCGTSQNYNISQKPEVEVMCYYSDITPNYSCCRVQSRGEWLNDNEEAAEGLLRAWLRAQDWYEANKDAAKEMVVKQTNSSMEFVSAYMDNEHYRLNLDPYKKSVERAWNWMSEMDLFPDGWDKINVDDHINTKIYKAALDANTKKYGSESKEFYDKMNQIFSENDA